MRHRTNSYEKKTYCDIANVATAPFQNLLNLFTGTPIPKVIFKRNPSCTFIFMGDKSRLSFVFNREHRGVQR